MVAEGWPPPARPGRIPNRSPWSPPDQVGPTSPMMDGRRRSAARSKRPSADPLGVEGLQLDLTAGVGGVVLVDGQLRAVSDVRPEGRIRSGQRTCHRQRQRRATRRAVARRGDRGGTVGGRWDRLAVRVDLDLFDDLQITLRRVVTRRGLLGASGRAQQRKTGGAGRNRLPHPRIGHVTPPDQQSSGVTGEPMEPRESMEHSRPLAQPVTGPVDPDQVGGELAVVGPLVLAGHALALVRLGELQQRLPGNRPGVDPFARMVPRS